LDFPPAFEDANGFLAFHFALVDGNVVDGDMIGTFHMIKDGSWFKFNVELAFGIATNTARK
jgi:hypothetical protein